MRLAPPVWRLSAVLVFAVAMLLSLPAGATSPEEERLAETKAKLDALHAEISGASAELAERRASLEDAEQRVNEVLAAVEEAELAVRRQQEAVAAAQAELAHLRSKAQRQRAITRDRAVELYKQGTGAPLVAVLSSSSTREVLDRSSLIEAVSDSDARSFERVSAAQVAVDAQRDVLEQEQAALSRVLDQQRELLAQVDEIRQEKAIAASDSASRLESLQAQESDLEEESARLAALARRAAAAPPPPAPAAPTGGGAPEQESAPSAPAPAPAPAPVSGGGWTWPAAGPLTSGFGYRWGRLHEGIDIGAPAGASTVAASAGTVIYAGSMSGYGNMVLVDHGGGIVTAYAHHTSILVSVGQGVGAGQQLGTVGSTGNVTGPHLHFEVRVGGVARDPLGYLP